MMKAFICTCVAMVGLAIGAGALIAAEHEHDHSKAPTTAPTTQKSEATNKNCPVSGDKIDPAVTIQYKDKTIAFCCEDCIKDFKKDPEKYLAKMK